MLDDLDKELEKRGRRFARYADDCNIYVKTQRAGERVMASVREFVEKKLKLKVNEKKSKVGDPPEVGGALEIEVPGTDVHTEQETPDTGSAQGTGEVQGARQGDNGAQ